MQVLGSKIAFCKVENKQEIVRYFYEREDSGWHQSIHKKGGSVDENIQDSLDSISAGSVMYEVRVGNKLAAFFVKYEDENENCAVEGFHIGKKFREPSFFIEFWKIVRTVFGKPFAIGICQSNEPAIEHLLKQGFKIVNRIVNNGKIFFILKLI